MALSRARYTPASVVSEVVQPVWLVLGMFRWRGWLLAGAAAGLTLLLIGTVTAIFDNPYFTRMTPVRTQDYAIWVATAILLGMIAGTFTTGPAGEHAGKALTGGFLADLAVGCAVCNKLVVLLLGTSGALSLFAPVQLYIGLASLALLGWTLVLRARTLTEPCSTTLPPGCQ